MTAHKGRILLVDDDAQLSRVLRTGLEAQGYVTRAENSSRRALQAAREFKPDLIVLDIVMPGKDGGDVAQEFLGQEETARIPIIFLTSLKSKTDPSPARPGDETVLAKPIGIAELTKHIEERLGREKE